MSISTLWRAGGLVLTLAFLTLFVGGGSRHAIGLVLKPMVDGLGWDRTQLGAVVALFMVVTALTMAAVGRLADRFPPGLILSGGFVISAVGIGGMAFAETAFQVMLLYGVTFAVGNGAVSITPVGVMLTRTFGRQAGLANAIAIGGMGIGQLAILAGLVQVLAADGWRDVFLWLGVFNGLAAPLLLLGLRRSDAAARRAARPAYDGMTVRQAAGTKAFWALMLVYAVCGFQDFFVSTHVVAIALDNGLASVFAGNLLAFMGLAGLAGVIAAGAWSDRAGPVWPTAACFVLRLAIFGLIMTATDATAIALFALLYGVTYWATAPLTVIFVRDRFGEKNLGLISGLVTMTHHGAGGLGALLGAMIFDAQGNYQSAFVLMALLSAVGLVATVALRGGRYSR